jgi:hypothetical protein
MPIFAFFGYRKLVHFLKLMQNGAQSGGITKTVARARWAFA